MNLNRLHNDIHEGALQLMAEHRMQLWTKAKSLCCNDDDADELVIRTIDQAIRRIGTYTGEGDILSWMMSILENLHKNDHRNAVVRGTTAVEADKLEEYAGADWSTDEEILRNSDSAVLREVLQRLDPKEREILLMRYYDGFSLKEIANVLNMPVSTVGRRIHLAMRLLAGKLGTKMGKKPLAVLGALLFGVTALFGAYQTGLIDAVVEKWHGSTDAVAEERGCGNLPASGQDEQSAFVPAHPQAPDNASDEQFDLTQEEEAQTQGEQEKENTMNIGQKAVVGLATAVSAVLPLTTEATPCLNLPTEWLGQATTTKGDGVSFSGNFTDVTSALTISFWVKNPTARSESGAIKYGYVIGNGCYSGKRGFAVAYQEQMESGQTVKGFFLQVRDNTGETGANAMLVQRVVTCNDVQDGNWHHIVVVYDATEKALVGYYDGVAQDSSGLLSGWPVSANNASLVNTLSIGRNAEQGGWALGGEIAEVSLWNRALTEEEVAAVHGAPIIKPASQTGLLGYWQFHDGQGATASDASVHGSIGTIKDGDDQPCTSDWGGDFDVYKNVVTASITGFVGLEDGNGHACSCTNVSPADCTVRWAWNGDLENFVHDAPEVFTDVGLYTNACRVTKENCRPFEGQATVDIRPVLYVATNGDDLASGKIRSPLKTVTEAIERMGSRGGRVYLNDGVYMLEKKFDTWPYTETVDYTCGWCVQVRAPIEIIGLSQNPKKVVLDAKGAKCALMAIRHPGASLRYLTLQNANADERGPAGSYGGGNLRLDAGSVSDCIFRNGFLHTGAGANLWASTGAGRVSRCAFYGGASGDSGVASVFAIGGLSTAPILDNCLIYGGGSEEVQNNAMVMARGGAKFVNCTISGARGIGAAARTYDKSSLFVNCAIYDNDGMACSGEMSGFRTCATADAISGGMDCKVIDEPKFKNAAKGDYRLTADSPLIGAGNVQSYHDFAVSETDLARKKRIRKNAISIGCYEFVQNGLMLMVW